MREYKLFICTENSDPTMVHCDQLPPLLLEVSKFAAEGYSIHISPEGEPQNRMVSVQELIDCEADLIAGRAEISVCHPRADLRLAKSRFEYAEKVFAWALAMRERMGD